MQKHTIYLILLISFSSNHTFGQNFKYLETENAKAWQTKFDTYLKLVDTLAWRTHKGKTKELLTYSFLSGIQ
jgi:hypothetical protein